MNKTPIEWTDFTSNPLRYRDGEGKTVWACVHASEGCRFCYAETMAHRLNRGEPFTAQNIAKVEPFLDERELRSMLTSKAITGKRVFVGDMTDLFGEWVPDEVLDRLFAAMSCRQDVSWQLLTKRASRLHEYINDSAAEGRVSDEGYQSNWPMLPEHHVRFGRTGVPGGWPPENVWLGVSVEDQRRADERVPLLLDTPAAVRFLSCEPLLEAVDLSGWLGVLVPNGEGGYVVFDDHNEGFPKTIHWVIAGGESGPGARPCDLAWLRSIVAQCRAAGTAVFVKQLGSKPFWDGNGQSPAGHVYLEPGATGWGLDLLHDRKGGEPDEWPADLRVREFPHA